jgi:hypothetical protein
MTFDNWMTLIVMGSVFGGLLILLVGLAVAVVIAAMNGDF